MTPPLPPIIQSAVIPGEGTRPETRDLHPPQAPSPDNPPRPEEARQGRLEGQGGRAGRPQRLTRAQKDRLLTQGPDARPCRNCAEFAPGIAAVDCCLNWVETVPESLARREALTAIADGAALKLLARASSAGYTAASPTPRHAERTLADVIAKALVDLTSPEKEGD